MGLQYSKHRRSEGSESQWTSYSDLFLGLSVVFLLLYITASLRTGTTGLQNQVEKERLSMQVQDLQNQLKAYNTIRQDTIKESSEQDQKVYENLLSKLDLLKEEAKDEKDKLRQQALENEQKETALNQYQQMVRNMVNSNVLAKSKIKRKEEVINEKNTEIKEAKADINELQDTVADQETQISEREKQIAMAQNQLDQKMKQLKNAYQSQKMTKKAYEQQVAKAKEEKAQEVQELADKNREVLAQLNKKASELQNINSDLEATKSQLNAKDQLAKNLVGQLENTKGKYEKQMNDLKGQYDASLAKGDQKAKELGNQISNLQGKMKDTEGQLSKALSEANARKNIANAIKRGFAKAGIKADVDGETGDVMIDFGDQYFDSGKANLKSGMVDILEKAFPVYASSLYENSEVKLKPSAVEIVGFASPTYKGKMVDPNVLKSGDRKAVDYNLDLSYARARSIFQHLFDKNKMSYKYQEELLPLVKVTGRSFLADKNFRGVAQQSQADFCAKYDCKKAQRVIIKFGFDK